MLARAGLEEMAPPLSGRMWLRLCLDGRICSRGGEAKKKGRGAGGSCISSPPLSRGGADRGEITRLDLGKVAPFVSVAGRNSGGGHYEG